MVDWQRFDVSSDHHVVFDQPGAKSATLNRVLAGRESTIAGRISAPGAVIIQNTAGVVFKGGARVDVGSLVATSQFVDADVFQSTGDLRIGGGELADARIVNEGTLTIAEAGLAGLVGGHVANHGMIAAERGKVVLASGEVTTIDFTGDGLAKVVVDGDAATKTAGIVNTGVVDAAEGAVLMTAGDVASTLDAAINTTGVVRAGGSVDVAGRIELLGRGSGEVIVAGLVDTAGPDAGGAVTATGETVRVTDGARIDARGDRVGGQVRIGGDRLGAAPLRRASVTTLAAGAAVDASGGETGGEIVVWSDDATGIDGRLAAGGGTVGGFIETSSLNRLGIGDLADVAPGAGGTWLLDPRNVEIAGRGDTGLNTPPGATPYVIGRGAVQAALNGDADVVITTAQPASTMPGDITVRTGLNWTGDGSLSLIADRDVILNSTVRSRGAGSFSVDAARNLIVNGTVRSDRSGAVSLTARTGDLIVTNARAGNRQIRTNTGALTLAAPDGSVLLRRVPGNLNNIQVYSTTAAVDISAADEILLQGGTRRGTWVRVGRAGNASDVTLTAPRVTIQGGSVDDSFAEVVSGTSGSVTIRASERIAVADGVGSPGRIQARNGALLTLEAPTQTWDGLVQSGPLGAGGSVQIAGAVTASVAPEFALDEDQNFVFEETTGAGAASSYTSTVPLTVTTSGTGTIRTDAPVTAQQVTLVAEEGVELGSGGTIEGTAPGDAIVISAGRSFTNLAGPAALNPSAPGARWLLYVDTFDAINGTEPPSGGFDLYGRTLLSDPPSSLGGFAGSRIVFGETPTLTVTGADATKTYGTATTPAFTVAGLRPGDTLATALDAGPDATSTGAAVDAPAGTAGVVVTATASDQGYAVALVDGTITTLQAPLTVAANDAARSAGEPNPAFTATFAGFVLGETDADLTGALAFDTPATPASVPGAYPITPTGLTSGNYALTFVPGTLTVTPATIPPAGVPGGTLPLALDAGASDVNGALESFEIGLPPITPGDAGFRTTLAEASSAGADAFALGFSLGATVAQAPAGVADLGAIAPATGDDGTPPGGVDEALAAVEPAAGPGADAAAATPQALAGCGGAINVGASGPGCAPTTQVDDFWSAFAGIAP